MTVVAVLASLVTTRTMPAAAQSISTRQLEQMALGPVDEPGFTLITDMPYSAGSGAGGVYRQLGGQAADGTALTIGVALFPLGAAQAQQDAANGAFISIFGLTTSNFALDGPLGVGQADMSAEFQRPGQDGEEQVYADSFAEGPILAYVSIGGVSVDPTMLLPLLQQQDGKIVDAVSAPPATTFSTTADLRAISAQPGDAPQLVKLLAEQSPASLPPHVLAAYQATWGTVSNGGPGVAVVTLNAFDSPSAAQAIGPGLSVYQAQHDATVSRLRDLGPQGIGDDDDAIQYYTAPSGIPPAEAYEETAVVGTVLVQVVYFVPAPGVGSIDLPDTLARAIAGRITGQ